MYFVPCRLLYVLHTLLKSLYDYRFSPCGWVCQFFYFYTVLCKSITRNFPIFEYTLALQINIFSCAIKYEMNTYMDIAIQCHDTSFKTHYRYWIIVHTVSSIGYGGSRPLFPINRFSSNNDIFGPKNIFYFLVRLKSFYL